MSLGTKKQQADRRYYLKHKKRMNEQGKVWRIQNKEKVKDYLATYYQNNKSQLDSRNKKWVLEHPAENTVVKHRNYTKNRVFYRQRRREIATEKRLKLFDVLGGTKCVRCGYSEDIRALTFHHVRDDGLEDRKIHQRYTHLYSFYGKHPDLARANLQVLCCNCNSIKKFESMGFKIKK